MNNRTPSSLETEHAHGWPTHADGTDVPSGSVFVFGSNLARRHGAGAALHALKRYGAVRGVGVGATGRSYAIATKGHRLEVLSIKAIAEHAAGFVAYARHNRDTSFFLTRVGCGLAGYADADIAPLFVGLPKNVDIPFTWLSYLRRTSMRSGA